MTNDLTIAGGRDVGYLVCTLGPRSIVYAGPFSRFSEARIRAEAWNAMTSGQRDLADQLYAAFESFNPYAEDAPNLNAWPEPAARRELAMWLAARIHR